MARKRLILVERGPEEPAPEDLPEKYRDIGWKDWLRGSYAKAWFIVIAFFVDVIAVLEIAGFFEGSLGIAFSLVCLVLLVLVELYLFHVWWGGLSFLFRGRRFL